MNHDPYPIHRCDGKFEFTFYDIKGEVIPDRHWLSCEVAVGIQSQIDRLDSLSWILHPTLSVESMTSDGQCLDYSRQADRVDISLPGPLQKGSERTIHIRYQGEMLAEENERDYNGYVGPEGIFMRSFAGWIPYCTVGPECFQFPDVPYLMEMRAPEGWTLFAHPDNPQVKNEDQHIVYRWDGRLLDQRIPHWGIVLLGGKYREVRQEANGSHLTFFSLSEDDAHATRVLDTLRELLTWLDTISEGTPMAREFRIAESPWFLQPTYQPNHTHFYRSSVMGYPGLLTWFLLWNDLMQWKKVSDIPLEDVEGELGDLLHQLFWVQHESTPKGWLDADLEMRARGYLGCIQKLPAAMAVDENQALYTTRHCWVWWMWLRFVGEEAFRRVLCRLRNGLLPKGTPLGTEEFFRLMGDEVGLPADWFVGQWFDRVTAPKLKFSVVQSKEIRDGYRVEATVRQTEDLYRMPLELVLRCRDGEQRRAIFMRERNYTVVFECQTEPVELEIDPDRRLLKVPSHTLFRPTDLGFLSAFGTLSGMSIPIREEGLRDCKRLVVAPEELGSVAEALCLPLSKRQLPLKGAITADASADRSVPIPTPVEVCTPDQVSEEMLAAHNLVLVGTPENNPLITEWGPPEILFETDQIASGKAVLGDAECGLIAFGLHPKNDDRFCMVVTGLSADALQQPPDFTEMPGDYLIYRRGKALEVGYRQQHRWVYRFV